MFQNSKIRIIYQSDSKRKYDLEEFNRKCQQWSEEAKVNDILCIFNPHHTDKTWHIYIKNRERNIIQFNNITALIITKLDQYRDLPTYYEREECAKKIKGLIANKSKRIFTVLNNL